MNPAPHRPTDPTDDPAESGSDEPGRDARPSAEPEASAGSSEPAASAEDVAALRATAAGLEDRLRRAQADFVNDVRRVQRQADDRVRFAAQAVVEDMLGVTDALHSAIEGLKDTEHERRVAEGLRMIDKLLLDALGRHGVARIDAMGKPFDPTHHEAVIEREHDGDPRTVLAVLRPGFTLHGRLVRAAQVVVGKSVTRGEGAPSRSSPPPRDDRADGGS